jgi:threonine dehydratase
VLVAPCSGGGLVTGCALGLSAAHGNGAIYAAEPAQLDDLRRSLEAGRRVANEPSARSICDALLAPTPGEITFALAQRLLAGSIAVSDDEVRHAMATAFSAYKLVLEPGGAAALAAVLSGKLAVAGKTVAVIASGGNVDPAAFAAALA